MNPQVGTSLNHIFPPLDSRRTRILFQAFDRTSRAAQLAQQG
jgi:hypothetical protein